MDLECKHCHGRLGVSGGMVRCDLCGVEVPDHELMKGEAPRRQELPEPRAIESEATLAGRVLALERKVAMLESRESARRKGA